MSAITSCDRNVRIVALTALMISALTVSASARDGTPIHHPIIVVTTRDHAGEAAKRPPPKGTYDTANATVRDHRAAAKPVPRPVSNHQ
jgi:hypothetical protein